MKNVISIWILIIFVCYTIICYAENINIKTKIVSNDNNIATVSTVNNDVEEYVKLQEMLDFFNVKEDDQNFEKSKEAIILLKDIFGDKLKLNHVTEEQKVTLYKIYDIILRHNNRVLKKYFDDEDYKNELLNKLINTKFLGDSQVSVMKAYNKELAEVNCFYSFKGVSVTAQSEKIEEVLNPDIKKIVFFNGCNIGIYKNTDEYVDAYKNIIEKIKNYNSDIEIYITSLLPATEEAITKDIANGDFCKLYNTGILDDAIKKEFSDSELAKYIETKWIVEDYLYDKDGIHYKPEFYYTYLPFVLYYIDYIDETN